MLRGLILSYLTGFSDSSALLGHELAYVLGQINDVHALPYLEGVLRDQLQHPMVRHEVSCCTPFTGTMTSSLFEYRQQKLWAPSHRPLPYQYSKNT